ncbi:matrixin [Krasilnikovia cinnamomea]|uniref:Matrixin n=1 Tax=Krasilnikovia cinnamomea TaxID=349313 RepID=A0A4Q7ZHA0_9ACTN|nr:matrixin family metalloprotease [Krasilnikovia cinnamomea]RZU49449.1 matrixin [Krasilnikovia cinnamomea]
MTHKDPARLPAADVGHSAWRRRLALVVLPLALVAVPGATPANASAPTGPASAAEALTSGLVAGTAATGQAAGKPRGNPRAYKFLSQSKPTDLVARWNPCTPITYRVNLARSRKGALKDVKTALWRVHQATGLRFVYKGTTNVIPFAKPGYSGDYPADTHLVIAWATPGKHSTQIPADAGGLAGMGGSWWTGAYTRTGRPASRITDGFVVLNASMRLPAGFGKGNRNGWQGTRGQLLMHEIGHAIGLDHPRIKDRHEIMSPTMSRKKAVWGAGDINGLRRLGTRGGCLYDENPTEPAGPAAIRVSSLPRQVPADDRHEARALP